MALPATIRVKLSSEEAGGVSVTPVVVQDLTPRELIEQMLAVTGKDEPRIRETLRRGTMVAGASRFRWTGWELDADVLKEVLAGFPDPDPSLPFSGERCVRAVLRGSSRFVDLTRESMSRKTLFGRRSFWDTLMEVTGASVSYRGYSYRDRADCYLRQFTMDEIERLRGATAQIRQRAVRDAVCSAAFSQAELYAVREN